MKYTTIVCFDPTVDPADVDRRHGHRRLGRGDGRPGRAPGGAPALSASDATTVRVRGGEMLISDGPFAETKEFMVGYDMLDCKDLDEAIEVASKHPLARRGAMELRPFGEE